jgi:hypothetical protein
MLCYECAHGFNLHKKLFLRGPFDREHESPLGSALILVAADVMTHDNESL